MKINLNEVMIDLWHQKLSSIFTKINLWFKLQSLLLFLLKDNKKYKQKGRIDHKS